MKLVDHVEPTLTAFEQNPDRENVDGGMHAVIRMKCDSYPIVLSPPTASGHFRSGKLLAHDYYQARVQERLSTAYWFRRDALKAGGVELDLAFEMCPDCAQRVRLYFNADGETFRLEGEPCPYPEGIQLIEFDVQFPSGKLVMANDLRSYYEDVETEDLRKYSHQATDYRFLQTTLRYAAAGLAHAYVGNRCPTVYWDADSGVLTIASLPEDTQVDKGEDCYLGTNIGQICTDLWWYSLADYDDLKRRFMSMPDATEDSWTAFLSGYCEVAEIYPGTYSFAHNPETEELDSTLYAVATLRTEDILGGGNSEP